MAAGRVYDNSGRAEGARLTRRRIIDSATELLLTGGYHAMSISALAKASAVSPQTVYNAVGGKAKVAKAVYDVLLVGDDAPVPMPLRPEFAAMSSTPNRVAFVRAYAGLSSLIYRRTGPLLGVLLAEGAGGDPGLAELVATIDEERLLGNTKAMVAMEHAHGLPEGFDREGFVTEVWVLTAPEIYDRYVRRSGWAHEQYSAWLEGSLVCAYQHRGGESPDVFGGQVLGSMGLDPTDPEPADAPFTEAPPRDAEVPEWATPRRGVEPFSARGSGLPLPGRPLPTHGEPRHQEGQRGPAAHSTSGHPRTARSAAAAPSGAGTDRTAAC